MNFHQYKNRHLAMQKSLFLCLLLMIIFHATAQKPQVKNTLNVGAASIDITPTFPVRLSGFAVRVKKESEGTALPLHAKALAFGNNYNNSAVIITADLIGISPRITDSVKKRLSKKVHPDRITISVSHTHSGPEIGTLLNILPYKSATEPFDEALLPTEHIAKINLYVEELVDKMEKVALEALATREASFVSWGIGKMDFGFNRRRLVNTIDNDMPLMKITDQKGNLKAVFLSYACHAVTMGAAFNKFHGDWVGDAQLSIEKRHPGVIALVAVGCGGDINPIKGQLLDSLSVLEISKSYGEKIADQTDSLLSLKLKPLNNLPLIKYKKINLALEKLPAVSKWSEIAAKDVTVKGYYARLALERIARGEEILDHVPYPIQVWRFGNELNIIFLAGEVVTDYSLRLKKELGKNNLWVLAYSNDVPCYIPSKRHLEMGGYEADASMYYYNKPARFSVGVEDQIISSVHQLLERKKNH